MLGFDVRNLVFWHLDWVASGFGDRLIRNCRFRNWWSRRCFFLFSLWSFLFLGLRWLLFRDDWFVFGNFSSWCLNLDRGLCCWFCSLFWSRWLSLSWFIFLFNYGCWSRLRLWFFFSNWCDRNNFLFIFTFFFRFLLIRNYFFNFLNNWVLLSLFFNRCWSDLFLWLEIFSKRFGILSYRLRSNFFFFLLRNIHFWGWLFLRNGPLLWKFRLRSWGRLYLSRLHIVFANSDINLVRFLHSWYRRSNDRSRCFFFNLTSRLEILGLVDWIISMHSNFDLSNIAILIILKSFILQRWNHQTLLIRSVFAS